MKIINCNEKSFTFNIEESNSYSYFIECTKYDNFLNCMLNQKTWMKEFAKECLMSEGDMRTLLLNQLDWMLFLL